MSANLTTREAADRLGIKPRSVVWAIKQGYIRADKRGRDYWIESAEIDRYKEKRRAAHRPKNQTSGATSGATEIGTGTIPQPNAEVER